MQVDNRAMAKAVLKRASMYDESIAQPTALASLEDKIDAWAGILTGKAWPSEAVDAVDAFYGGKTWGKSLMPGDVIEYCRRLPFWSSPEHATFRIEQWLRWPNCHQIEDHCGIEVPESTRQESREATVNARLDWGRQHWQELLAGLLSGPRHIPAEHNWNLERYP